MMLLKYAYDIFFAFVYKAKCIQVLMTSGARKILCQLYLMFVRIMRICGVERLCSQGLVYTLNPQFLQSIEKHATSHLGPQAVFSCLLSL